MTNREMCEKQCVWMTQIGCSCDNNNYETENQSLIENRNPECNQPMIKPCFITKDKKTKQTFRKGTQRGTKGYNVWISAFESRGW